MSAPEFPAAGAAPFVEPPLGAPPEVVPPDEFAANEPPEFVPYARAHPSEVSRHFHRDMGVTLARYRTRLRLLQFIRQVDSSERDLMASASIAGFGSYSQAHRSFQAELGCGPRQFFNEGLREQMQATYSAV